MSSKKINISTSEILHLLEHPTLIKQPELKNALWDCLLLRSKDEDECIAMCQSHSKIVKEILLASANKDDESIRLKSFDILINYSSYDSVCQLVLQLDATCLISMENSYHFKEMSVMSYLFDQVLDPMSTTADHACQILANITRVRERILKSIQPLLSTNVGPTAVKILCTEHYNLKGCSLDYLAFVIQNLTQEEIFQKLIMDNSFFEYLLPQVTIPTSVIRRVGIIGILRNCSMNSEYHRLMFDKDILYFILLPLVHSESKFFLKRSIPKKERESEPLIRKSLLEILYLLCATSFGRNTMRKNDVYEILKDLHNTESEECVVEACENVVHVLIREEDEIGVDNLATLEIPEEIMKKFRSQDEDDDDEEDDCDS